MVVIVEKMELSVILYAETVINTSIELQLIPVMFLQTIIKTISRIELE